MANQCYQANQLTFGVRLWPEKHEKECIYSYGSAINSHRPEPYFPLRNSSQISVQLKKMAAVDTCVEIPYARSLLLQISFNLKPVGAYWLTRYSSRQRGLRTWHKKCITYIGRLYNYPYRYVEVHANYSIITSPHLTTASLYLRFFLSWISL